MFHWTEWVGPGSLVFMTDSSTILTCDLVLFDMDGTLVDSRVVIDRVWCKWVASHGLTDLVDAAVACVGMPTLETVAQLAPHLDAQKEADAIDAAEAADFEGLRAVAGAARLLAALPLPRWAVVTSATRSVALARLGAVGLPLPAVLVTADDVPFRKPDPLPYLTAVRRLGGDPTRALVFEDSPVGAQAGRAAGATVVAMRTTFPSIAGCAHAIADFLAVEVLEAPAAGPLTVRLG
jgi:sugar-phosphatase